MNVHEIAKASKQATTCGNWTIKLKNNQVVLEYWTIVNKSNPLDPRKRSNYSNSHNKRFQQTVVNINRWTMNRVSTILIEDHNGNYYTCHFKTRYRPANRMYKQQTEEEILATLNGVPTLNV